MKVSPQWQAVLLKINNKLVCHRAGALLTWVDIH